MADSSKTFCDLSHHQAPVDLAAYARAGHDRVALKATEGTGFTDPAFAERWAWAGRLGLARVAYHFARAKFNGADEFDHCWQVVQAAGGLTNRDRLCLDVEDPDTPDRAAANAREFTAAAVAQGVSRGLVYTYNYYATHHAISPGQFPGGWRQLWLADYTAGQADGDVELGAGWNWNQVAARQYTDKETVAGVAGPCDASRVLNDWLAPTPVKPTQPEDVSIVDADTRKYLDVQFAKLNQTLVTMIYGDTRVDAPGGASDTHPENLQRIRDDLEAGLAAINDKLDALAPPAPGA